MAQLREIIAAISGLAGFDTSEVDTAAIPNTDVRGYIIDRPQSAREVLAVLRALYRFDVQDTARLHFVGRGRGGDTPSSLTEDTDTLTSAQRVRTQETELPRIATLSYLDADRQLEFGNATAQRSLVHRGLGAISSRQRFDLRAYIVLTPDQARGMVERMLYAYWRERDRMTLNLPPRYLAISPGDFVSFLDRRNRRMLARVDRQDIGADLTSELEVTVVDSVTEVTTDADSTSRLVAGARTGEGLPDIDAPEPTPLIAPGRRTDIDGRLRMISVSALADADVDVYGRTVRPYATLERYEEASWDNASIRVSQTRTGAQRTAIRGALASQIVGRLIAPPPDDWRPDFIDRDGQMTVQVIDETARERLISLRPTNEMEFVSGRSQLVILRHDGEAAVLAYRFLGQSGTDSRVLVISRLLRGLRGTEHLDRGYTGGETVVFLIPGERPAYVAINKAFRNRELFFQANLEATSLGVIPHRLVPTALRPYSPTHLTIEGAAGDVTATWVRRTRMGGEDDFLDAIEDVPNVEPVERYDVDVLAADGTVIHHSADVRATEYVYPLTQRQTDEAGLEVEYRFEIGLDSDGRGGRQDVAETILSSSHYSGNILTMQRQGELLGVDWWASSGTQRTVRHAVFLMDSGTLLNVDTVLSEPSEPVSFDGRTGENFVSHNYAEPVPFAAGDNVLVAVQGSINVVPAGAMRDPRIRPPFSFSVRLNLPTDNGIATTLGTGMLTMRLRYRMAISEHDARTVRVAQVGWAGLGTPTEVTFTPDPLRDPNRLRAAVRITSPDAFGFARATPMRFGVRLGTDRGQAVPVQSTGLRPWVLTGRVRVAARSRVGVLLYRRRTTFVSFPLSSPWRFIRTDFLTSIWELRPTVLSGFYEPASSLKTALRLRPSIALSGLTHVGRATTRVRLNRIGPRLVYEVPVWVRTNPVVTQGRTIRSFSGALKLREERPSTLSVPTGSGLGLSPPPLPSHWIRGRVRSWIAYFRFWGEQLVRVGRYVPRSSFGLVQYDWEDEWGYVGNPGAGSASFAPNTLPRPSSDELLYAHFDPNVVRELQFEVRYDTDRVRWEWQENYGLPPHFSGNPSAGDLARTGGPRQTFLTPWTTPPTSIDEISDALRDAGTSLYHEGVLRIEGPRSGALQIATRLNMPERRRDTVLRIFTRFRQPDVAGPVRRLQVLQTAVNLTSPRYRIPGRRVSYRAADLGDTFFIRYNVGNSGLNYEVPIAPFSANPDDLPKLPSHWMLNQAIGAALVYFRARNRFGIPSVDMIFANRVDGFPADQQLDPAHNASFYGSIKSTPVIEDKTADYTIAAGDLGKTIRLTGDTARTFTFPSINLDGVVSAQWWVRIANASTATLTLATSAGQSIVGGNTMMPAGAVWIVQGHSDTQFAAPFVVGNTGAAQLSTDPVELSWRPSDLESNTASRITYVFSDAVKITEFLNFASANATITLIGPEAT